MRKLGTDLWAIVTYALLLVIAFVVLGVGAYWANVDRRMELLAAGIVCVVVVAALMPLALTHILGRSAAQREMRDLQRQQHELLRQIHEHTMLSDSAKRIAYRRDERAMLHRAIEEDIANEDWQAAMVLVTDMGERFGYREEAEAFRERIERSRSDAMNQRITDALNHFENVLATHDWTAAYAEAARIQRLFPDSHRVKDLEQRVRQAWEDHKRSLEREFLDAAGRGDVDHAMQLLRTLDAYLSPREAEPYREVARGVVSKARENLGLQFKMAVQEHDWATAVRIGETIMEEFPNTVMAQEVRERIDLLRARAAHAAGGLPIVGEVQALEGLAASREPTG